MREKKYKALKNHICGNNDGECVCTCFDKGYRKSFKDISESNKKARKDNNYYKLLENGQALLDYIPTLIDIIVDNEHQYRKFEAEMAQKRDENGKLMSGTYCETQAKATQFYKEFRKAEMIKEWVYDSVNLAKKLAVDSDNNLKATKN